MAILQSVDAADLGRLVVTAGERALSTSALYRAWQFFRAMLVRVRVEEYALVEQRLSAAQVALFRSMPRCDQRHCLDVFYALRDGGYGNETLLRAALIHDVGKSAGRLPIWHRVAVVLLDRFWPGRLSSLAAHGQGWKAPFVVHAQHARLGAQWAAEAGCSPQVVALIRAHHEPGAEEKRLAALQWADTNN